MPVVLTFDTGDLDAAILRLGPLTDFEPGPLMSAIGALGESQTARRITDEKTSPDGVAWAPNMNGTSILLETGRNLLGSLAWRASDDEAEWGASWEYAHVHQDGATIVPKSAKALLFRIGNRTIGAKRVTIPPRPFIGLSDENRSEIRELVTDMLGLAP